MFYVYMLQCRDTSFYVGHTDDLEARLGQHHNRTYCGYTASRLPVKLVFAETFNTRDEAFYFERKIKGWTRTKKIALASRDWELVSRLASRHTPPTSPRPSTAHGFECLTMSGSGRKFTSVARHAPETLPLVAEETPMQLPETARQLIEGKNFAHIATVMKDGSPQVSAVWIAVRGDKILINTAEGRLKTRNMRRDPRVAISIAGQDDAYTRTHIRGRVVEMTHDGADDDIDMLAKKYLGADSYPGRRADEQRVTVLIEPEKVA